MTADVGKVVGRFVEESSSVGLDLHQVSVRCAGEEFGDEGEENVCVFVVGNVFF